MHNTPSVHQRRRPPNAHELTQIPWLALLQADERAQIVPQLVVSDPQAGDIVPVVMVAVVLSLLATLYPSWRAARTQPAEALRYE